MLSRMQQRNKNIFLVQVLVSSFSCLFHCVSTFDGVICCQIARTKDPLAHDLLGENEKQQTTKKKTPLLVFHFHPRYLTSCLFLHKKIYYSHY
jgi:hypothetical protein